MKQTGLSVTPALSTAASSCAPHKGAGCTMQGCKVHHARVQEPRVQSECWRGRELGAADQSGTSRASIQGERQWPLPMSSTSTVLRTRSITKLSTDDRKYRAGLTEHALSLGPALRLIAQVKVPTYYIPRPYGEHLMCRQK